MEQNLIKSEIESRIFTIRGMQVMLDKDLAELYGVNTMRLNEQVLRKNDFQKVFVFNFQKKKWPFGYRNLRYPNQRKEDFVSSHAVVLVTPNSG